jgi:hypothetical protein
VPGLAKPGDRPTGRSSRAQAASPDRRGALLRHLQRLIAPSPPNTPLGRFQALTTALLGTAEPFEPRNQLPQSTRYTQRLTEVMVASAEKNQLFPNHGVGRHPKTAKKTGFRFPLLISL